MKIFCDYCEKSTVIAPDELADWLVLDPESGAQLVMCASCQSGPTLHAPELAYACPRCGDRCAKDTQCQTCGMWATPIR
jgi:predicted RNA-binding Zn-ribbon protein involved in translation (DUF1610 family)